jgi:glutamate racemase
MIGIFDSGSGGLTVLRAIRKYIPSADIVYFGDIKNAPYGSKSREELSRLTFAAMSKVAEEGATSIVSACNSVSASLAASVLDVGGVPSERVIEMVGPTVRYFKHADSKILLCATPATIESGIYQNAFSMIGKEVQTLAIPELAGAIEFGASEEEIEKIIRTAFASVPEGSFKVLILACTHYPLALPVFERVLGKEVLIFDPADAVAERVEKEWWPREAGNGKVRFLVSKDSEPFKKFAAEIMGKDVYTIEVVDPVR